MKPVMQTEEYIFENSVVINFDGLDDQNKLTHTGGYLRVTKDDECQCYNVIIFGNDGDVVLETNVQFDFKPISEIY